MRISLVLLFCFLVVVVNSNAVKTTTRKVVANGGNGVTKAPVKKNAYDYLRSVRGKKSCASGTCPFWERHGRSFAALRCYSQEYKECVCLHRMCFSSCMFNRTICNNEMVSCLQQICRRCMAVSEHAMCAAYDSMAERVAASLSAFSCYACCPANQNANTNANNRPNGNTMVTNRPTQGNGPKPVNGASSANGANAAKPTNNANAAKPVNNANAAKPVNNANAAKPNNNANAAKPNNNANAAKPNNNANAAKPNNNANAAKPNNNANAAKPNNNANAAKPVNNANAAKPVNGVNTAKPANNVNAPKPINGVNAGNGALVGANQPIVVIPVINNGNAPRPPNGLPANALPNVAGNSVNGGNQSPKLSPLGPQAVRSIATTRRTAIVSNNNIKTTGTKAGI